ncbi:MAG: hypothetical protein IJX80_00445 [Clostridia bacterium]|nr:hypothetical protein [Clostridia bacterium]
MNRIESYIPEHDLFDGKDHSGCRIFHDDCAMLNAYDSFRIVSERGFQAPIGTPFCSVLPFSETSISRLQKFIRSDDECLLLSTENASVLFFSALLQSTGLLLAVRIAYDEKNVRKALEHARYDAFSPIFRPNNDQSEGEIALTEQLTEIFYYTERMLKQPHGAGLWTHLYLIANFVGCRLEHVSLPANLPALSNRDWKRPTAFLLCTFMLLRHHTGRNVTVAKERNVGKVQINNVSEVAYDPTVPGFSLLLQHLPLQTAKSKLPEDERELFHPKTTPFNQLLALPCFKNIIQSSEDKTLVFEFPFYQNTPFGILGSQLSMQGHALVFKILNLLYE